jgi:hypothetical protein
MPHYNGPNTLDGVTSPAEIALARLDDVFHLLLALGADINLAFRASLHRFAQEEHRKSLFDWVQDSLQSVEKQLVDACRETTAIVETRPETGWQEYYSRQRRAIALIREKPAFLDAAKKEKQIKQLYQCKTYLEGAHWDLVARQAKTWLEIKASRN